MCLTGETHHQGFAVHIWLHLRNEGEVDQVPERLLNCIFSEEMLPEQEEMIPPCEDGQKPEVRSPLLLRGIHTFAAEVFALSWSHKNAL